MLANSQRHNYRFIISGGGTGGHIFPAIAIAEALIAKTGQSEILFIGAMGRMEMEKVPQAGYNIKGLWISGLQRKLSVRNILFPLKVVWSMGKARKIIKKFAPDAVIGTGGYASGPTLKMAAALNIPTIIQEQNSYPGITNRILSRKAQRICVAYDGMDQFFPKEKIAFTGNPVRQNILESKNSKPAGLEHFGLKPDHPVLLVVGGSQGARSVNQAITAILKTLAKHKIQLIWQTGTTYFPMAEQAAKYIQKEYPEALEFFRILPFIREMELAYGAADMVVSRAGAIAISELCIVGKPCILVPLPSAAEDHQTKNARSLENKDAAIVIKDQELEQKLEAAILELAGNPEKQKNLTANISRLAINDAASRIADEIIKTLHK